MTYHTMLYYIVLYNITLYFILHHNISYHTIPYHIISYHVVLYHIISYHIEQYHIISDDVLSYHIILYYIVMYCIKSYYRECIGADPTRRYQPQVWHRSHEAVQISGLKNWVSGLTFVDLHKLLGNLHSLANCLPQWHTSVWEAWKKTTVQPIQPILQRIKKEKSSI